MIPSFFCNAFLNFVWISFENPKLPSSTWDLSFSSILKTTLSPNEEGNVETLKSTSFFPIFIEILPSWGKRRSEISRLDIIFILEIIIWVMFFWYLRTSFKTPSTRNLIVKLFSNGSKCISEALALIALVIVALISLIIGPLFLSSKRSSDGWIELARFSKFNWSKLSRS